MGFGINPWLVDLWSPAGKHFRLLLLSLVAGLYGIFLWCSWYQYPAPYADEAFFVPPALAFSEAWHFFSPNLDPHRALHWMPVGYAVLCGIFVKAVGLGGIWGARLFSSVVFGVILILLHVVGRRLGRLQLVLLYLPFVSMPLLTLSRLARMEGLLLAVMLSAMACVLVRRVVAALALALLSTLVHPNGAYALVVCVFAAFWLGRGSGWRELLRGVRGWEWGCLVLSVGCVLAYVGYELNAYADFASDMSYQFKRKARGMHLLGALPIFSVGLLAVGGVCAWWRRSGPQMLFLVWGGALMLSRLIGQEVWYSPLYMVGVSWVGIALLPSARWRSQGAQLSAPAGWVAPSVAAVGVVGLVCVFVLTAVIKGWHGGRIDLQRSAVESDRLVAGQIAAAWGARRGGRPSTSLSCLPFEECLLLLGSSVDVDHRVRLNNPVTMPPIGQDCVWVHRERLGRVDESDVVVLNPGVIRSFEIKPCGASWPGQSDVKPTNVAGVD